MTLGYYQNVMKTTTLPTLREMFEAGVHFGHKKQYSDARGRDYFYCVRDKVVVINLEKTRSALEKALGFLAEKSASGSTILFVGTKPQAREIIKKVATQLDMPFVVNRWLGGTLTNFETIERNLKKLKKLEEELNDVNSQKTKKEKTVLKRTIDRSKYNLSGMEKLNQLPQVLFIIDPVEEKLAIKEAAMVGIPTVAIMDTNANPRNITYPIPANDDTPASLGLVMELVKDTIKDNFKPKTEQSDVSAKNGKQEKPATKAEVKVKSK